MVMSSNSIVLFNKFSAKLKAFIKTKVSSSEDAEDILQNIFVKIHNNLDKLTTVNNIEQWVYRVTRNAIIDYYRKQKKTLPVEIDDISEFIDQESVDDNYLLLTKCFKPMINTLPEKYRTALLLVDIEGLKQSAAASKLNITLSGTKSRVQRARQMLKAAYFDCCAIHFNYQGQLHDVAPRNQCDSNCNACC